MDATRSLRPVAEAEAVAPFSFPEWKADAQGIIPAPPIPPPPPVGAKVDPWRDWARRIVSRCGWSWEALEENERQPCSREIVGWGGAVYWALAHAVKLSPARLDEAAGELAGVLVAAAEKKDCDRFCTACNLFPETVRRLAEAPADATQTVAPTTVAEANAQADAARKTLATARAEAEAHKQNAERLWKLAGENGQSPDALLKLADAARAEESRAAEANARAEKSLDALHRAQGDALALFDEAISRDLPATPPASPSNTATPGADKPAAGAKGKQGKGKPTGKRGKVGRKEAAQYMGVSVRTLLRWIKEPRKIPDEWAGFSPAVLKTKADWAAWKAGLGTRESGITTVDKAGSQLERGRWGKTGPR